MKKIYSLFLVGLSMFAFGQGTEDFTSSNLTASYADNNFTNATTGVTWTYTHSRNEGDFPIDGKGLMLRRASDSSLSGTISNGVGSFTFQYRKAFTGGNVRQLEVYANGVVVGTTPEFGEGSGEQTEVYTFTVPINIDGEVIIKIKGVGETDANRQTTIDNIEWTAYQAMGVSDLEASKVNMTTVWANEAVFTTKGNASVEIYNMNGQLVQKAKGNNSFNVNVSALTKGNYVVKVVVDGQVSTFKAIKK